MKVVAHTEKGYLVEATRDELNSIQKAVTGKPLVQDEPKIGHKFPAIDYSATIHKIKELGASDTFRHLRNRVRDFQGHFERLVKDVDSAADIETEG